MVRIRSHLSRCLVALACTCILASSVATSTLPPPHHQPLPSNSGMYPAWIPGAHHSRQQRRGFRGDLAAFSSPLRVMVPMLHHSVTRGSLFPDHLKWRCPAVLVEGRRPEQVAGDGIGGAKGIQCGLSLRVVNTSKTKEKWADTACDDYAQRVRKMGYPVDQVVLKPAPGPPKFTPEQQKDEEGKALLSRVDKASEFLVVLDERGDMLTSHQLADLLQKVEDDGVRVMTFAIGGAHGHSSDVQSEADKMISLSKMVMNHQIARVVLMEQIYRAYTIMKGVPYHK